MFCIVNLADVRNIYIYIYIYFKYPRKSVWCLNTVVHTHYRHEATFLFLFCCYMRSQPCGASFISFNFVHSAICIEQLDSFILKYFYEKLPNYFSFNLYRTWLETSLHEYFYKFSHIIYFPTYLSGRTLFPRHIVEKKNDFVLCIHLPFNNFRYRLIRP
jgi:hypothetical protein